MKKCLTMLLPLMLFILTLAISPSLGEAIKVQVKIPVPPKISTDGVKKILVASFITGTNIDFDVNREIVRLLKSELRKKGNFTILDVPPPSLPEQTVEEIKNNYQFWKHLGEEYDANLILSGTIDFHSVNRSGFVNRDDINTVTGQKVRRTVYAEREEFKMEFSLFFFRGLNGAFLYEDNFSDSAIFEGTSNDALQVFYDFNDRIKDEIAGIVTPQSREEQRFIFFE
ncbi:MAG: hypothetical protein AB1756_03820 [Acidobacteriota bacterium]